MRCGITRPHRILVLTCTVAGSALLWWAFSLSTWAKVDVPDSPQVLFSALFAICSQEIRCWVPPSKSLLCLHHHLLHRRNSLLRQRPPLLVSVCCAAADSGETHADTRGQSLPCNHHREQTGWRQVACPPCKRGNRGNLLSSLHLETSQLHTRV
uniref:Uncharacterized protein n=1 Tax=Myotis myotis TaxID=51298 RepID=A0A7J7SS60_MYOMY|nr:hypothetical protein mMyoMyo1_009438 [Myotis myotis]